MNYRLYEIQIKSFDITKNINLINAFLQQEDFLYENYIVSSSVFVKLFYGKSSRFRNMLLDYNIRRFRYDELFRAIIK